jgi:hypothetical protein
LKDDYFELPLERWVREYLQPALTLQLSILNQYIESKKMDKTIKLDDIFSKKFGRQFLDVDSGDYISMVTVDCIFLSPHQFNSTIHHRIRQLNYIIRQLNVMLDRQTLFDISSSFNFAFLRSENIPDFYDAHLLMFPFLQWITHWVDFLEFYYCDYPAVQKIIKKLKVDLKSPKELYYLFQQSPHEQLIKYLTIA